MWLGTTNKLLLQSPNLLLSIALATISKVLPAPTSWANKVFPPYKTLAIAFTWCGLNVISGFIPSNVIWLPSYSLGIIALNFSL